MLLPEALGVVSRRISRMEVDMKSPTLISIQLEFIII
jgi:hypothetical protein